jgi:hypothetical protein
MGVFDLNNSHEIVVETFMDSNIYYIDNFYKNPNVVLEFLKDNPASVHVPPSNRGIESFNGKKFYDLRHKMIINEIESVYSYLSGICGQKPKYNHRLLMTNKTKFFVNTFNDYENNYWYPHKDYGYTALIYLNKNDDECGTNLYESVIPDLDNQLGEHLTPWRNKGYWSVVKTLKPKYNRCVIFDGLKFNHGMRISDDRYFGNEYRLNQVFFFEKKPINK